MDLEDRRRAGVLTAMARIITVRFLQGFVAANAFAVLAFVGAPVLLPVE